MKRAVSMLLSAVFVTVLVACNAGEEGSGGDVAAGEELFTTGGSSNVPCITCHSVEEVNLVGPSLHGIASKAGERIDGVSAEEYLHQSITQPSTYIVEGYSDAMYKDYALSLSEEDINNLIAYLMTLE